MPHITYDHLVLQIFKLMLKGTGITAIVHWVVDTYPVISIMHSQDAKRDYITPLVYYNKASSLGSNQSPVSTRELYTVVPIRRNASCFAEVMDR